MSFHTDLSASQTTRNIQCAFVLSIGFSVVPFPVPGRPDVAVLPLPALAAAAAPFPLPVAAAPVPAWPARLVFAPVVPAAPPTAPSGLTVVGCLKTTFN